jgi:hypothetical protein
MNTEQIISLLLGLLIVGEAIMLLIGMYVINKKQNEWKTRFNTNTLLIDIAFGMIIIFNAIENMPYKVVAIVVLIITHLFREIEYFYKEKKNRFIFNLPLFIVNTIKLIGLIVFPSSTMKCNT